MKVILQVLEQNTNGITSIVFSKDIYMITHNSINFQRIK